jgi:hypothetical protein
VPDPVQRPDHRAKVARRCIRQAQIGTVAWIAWIAITGFRPAEAMLLLSPLVLFPLVLRLAVDDAHPGNRAWTAATWMHLPGALCLLVSFAVPRGVVAGALTLPWIVTTATTAAAGAWRLVSRRRVEGSELGIELGIDAGLAFVVIGAGWTSAYQLGLRPLGFSDTIVLLTGEHFHYAGFVLPVLATLVARTRGAPWGWVVIAVVAGVPLTAIGITLSPVVEVFAAVVVVAGGLGVSAGQLLTARGARTTAAILLGVSAMALAWAMVLAALYTVGEFRGVPWPTIPDMIDMHGTANALGTALAGLWGWTVHLDNQR